MRPRFEALLADFIGFFHDQNVLEGAVTDAVQTHPSRLEVRIHSEELPISPAFFVRRSHF
jgi:hypothetical protein